MNGHQVPFVKGVKLMAAHHALATAEFNFHALKLHILEVERKNHVVFAPGLAWKMEVLNKKSDEAAQKYPYREHPKVSHLDVQAAIHCGVITDSYPAARGYKKVIMLGSGAVGSCRLTVYLSVPGPGSSAPLYVEDFIFAND